MKRKGEKEKRGRRGVSSEKVKERWRGGQEVERKEKKRVGKKPRKGTKTEKERRSGGLIAVYLVVR